MLYEENNYLYLWLAELSDSISVKYFQKTPKFIYLDWQSLKNRFNRCSTLTNAKESLHQSSGIWGSKSRHSKIHCRVLKELKTRTRREAFGIVFQKGPSSWHHFLGVQFFIYKWKKYRWWIVQGSICHSRSQRCWKEPVGTHLLRPQAVINKLAFVLSEFYGFNIWSQDVNQAYLHSAQNPSCDIKITLAREVRLLKNVLLEFLNLLDGLRGSGDCWYSTITDYIEDDMHMTLTISDRASLPRLKNDSFQGRLGTNVDYIASTGTKDPENEGKKLQGRIESRPKKYSNFKFPGIEIVTKENGSIFFSILIYQMAFAYFLNSLPPNSSFLESRSKWQKLSWLMHF